MPPFGISVAPEEFQRIIDEHLGGLGGVKAIVDDMLIWGDDDSFEEATASHASGRILNLIRRHAYGCGPSRQRIYT